MVMLDCPALSKDRTMRLKVSENFMQGSVSVKKKNIIEMILSAFLWDNWSRISDKRWIKEHRRIKGTDESFPIVGSLIPLMHHDLHHFGTLIQIQPCPQSLLFFSQQCPSKKITGSGNEIDLDPANPKGRHPYLKLHH